MAFPRSLTYTFRPTNENLDRWCIINEWCRSNGRSMSELWNALIPAIEYALTNETYLDEETSQLHVVMDFGGVEIKKIQALPTKG